jgi:minor histocompatibility antigen H13
MMVTVAKSLDVPIKLMFPRPGPADEPGAPPSHAMLGLGDVVLPGIMIGLALRFDLYLFYLRRQRRRPAATSGEYDSIEKPTYHSLAGRWSDHFWSHSFMGRPLWANATPRQAENELPFTFPKIYFTAALVGYVLGLLATLGVMMVWNHAQPALLYLVPGVLGSLWLTALVRGELSLMWTYTEEMDDEGMSSKNKNSKSTKVSKENVTGASQPSKDTNNGTHVLGAADDSSVENKQAQRVQRTASHRPEREVFSFSIEAPWQSRKPRSIAKPKEESNATGSPKVGDESYNRAPSKTTNQNAGAEPAGKRVRLI